MLISAFAPHVFQPKYLGEYCHHNAETFTEYLKWESLSSCEVRKFLEFYMYANEQYI